MYTGNQVVFLTNVAGWVSLLCVGIRMYIDFRAVFTSVHQAVPYITNSEEQRCGLNSIRITETY